MINLLLQENPVLLYLLAGLFFLCVGSLLNVIIYRLPLMLESEWTVHCRSHLQLPAEEQPRINLFQPRSFCPRCKTQVKAWHNIPLLSYLMLRGRCPACAQAISLRYPLIELITLLLSLWVCWFYQFDLRAAFALPFVWMLSCLFMIDWDKQLLPDGLTLGLLWLGLIANTQDLFTPLDNAVLSAAGAWLFLWIIMQLFYLITGKVGMGHGDFKLFAALGAWLGWQLLPLVLLLSSVAGAIVGLLYLKLCQKDSDTPIPFGPFLCLAGFIALFWGHDLVSAYLHYAGLV